MPFNTTSFRLPKQEMDWTVNAPSKFSNLASSRHAGIKWLTEPTSGLRITEKKKCVCKTYVPIMMTEIIEYAGFLCYFRYACEKEKMSKTGNADLRLV